MSAAHVNTIADTTPQLCVAYACSTRSDMRAAGAREAFNAAAHTLAARYLR